MNKQLMIFFLINTISLVGMNEPQQNIYRRLAISAEKKDVATDLTFEKAIVAIEKEIEPGHLKDWSKAFARTYLRMEQLKNYNQLKQELDSYCKVSDPLSRILAPKLISVLKKAIDNWDTGNPHNIFKYVDDPQEIVTFLADDYFLGLKDPRKDKRQ